MPAVRHKGDVVLQQIKVQTRKDRVYQRSAWLDCINLGVSLSGCLRFWLR